MRPKKLKAPGEEVRIIRQVIGRNPKEWERHLRRIKGHEIRDIWISRREYTYLYNPFYEGFGGFFQYKKTT